MSKRPIEWHQDCFRNLCASTQQKRRDAARLTADLELAERELASYAEQIAAAAARGLEGFDRDRFLVKRSAM